MAFSSLSFIFIFLPVALILYRIVPRKGKNLVLVLLSLVFYAWGETANFVILIFSVLFNYVAGIEIDAVKKRVARGEYPVSVQYASLIGTVAMDVFVLGFFKYSALPLPVGLSFYTFTVLSYILDIYMDRAEVERNIINMALYVTLFPKLVSGPIVQYKDIRDQIRERSVTRAGFGSGLNLFLIGLFKKMLIADNLGTAFTAISGLEQMSAASAWMGMIFYSLQLYFDFSGYSDMAIGLARMFGFRIAKNFDHPYTSVNVQEFWRRWHISLGAWFRDYVYIPLGGNRVSTGRWVLNIAIVWLLTGVWHGSTWNFVVWGLYHGLFVLLDKLVLNRAFERVPHWVRVLLTCIVTFVGWVFFFSPTLGGALHWLGQMIGLDGRGVFDATAWYYLRNNLILLIVAILACSPRLNTWYQRLTVRRSRKATTISAVIYLVLFAFCIAGMVNNTYSSFLYFKF